MDGVNEHLAAPGESTAEEGSEPRPSRSWMEAASRWLLLVASLLVGAGICELLLRAVPPSPTYDRKTAVPSRRAAAGQVLLRGRPLPSAGMPDGFRILVVGDSFTWGPGLYPEDTYPYRLQRRLDERLAEIRPLVACLSRPGWNTETELREVRRHLAAVQPDLLVLGLVLNDPEPSDRSKVRRRQRHLLRRTPRGEPGQFLYHHSRLYRTVYDRLENTRQRRRFSAYYHDLYAEGPDWTAFLTALHGFRRLADENAFEIVVVVFPVFDSQLDAGYAYRDLHDLLRRLGQGLGLRVLDLLPAYEGIDARRLALEPFTDAHPGELAHRIAADRISGYLVKHRLVPVPEPAERR